MVAEDTTNETRAAVRFFWAWLLLATGVSVAGNVTHAVLAAPPGTVRLAAAAAVVPPAVLLGATHSVALLVRTRRAGFIYWCALVMTLALAACAFVLSFDALRDLAVALGMPASRAWLWPVAIDVSIANSTLSLLSLSPPRSLSVTGVSDDASSRSFASPAGSSPASGRAGAESVAPRPSRTRQKGQRAGADHSVAPPPALVPHADAPQMGHVERPLAAVAAAAPKDAMDLRRWRVAADELVRDGVTSKDPAIVAAVLADDAAGTAPTTIGRRHNLHHSTVGRILEGNARRVESAAGAERLTG